MSGWNVELVDDSFARLKDLPADSFDVCITDPPFSKHVQDNLCSGSLVGTKAVPKYELSFAPLESYAWAIDLLRVTKRWSLVCCAVEDCGKFELAVGRPAFVRSGIWYKPNSMGQLTADRPATAYEAVSIFHPLNLKKRSNGRGSWGIWKCNGTRGKKGRHPNEKPIDLAMKWVALFSERGETIFDPFCGSGAFGEAAVRLGRGYVGWDSDPEWVEKSRARLFSPGPPASDEEAIALCRMNAPLAP